MRAVLQLGRILYSCIMNNFLAFIHRLQPYERNQSFVAVNGDAPVWKMDVPHPDAYKDIDADAKV